VGLVHSKPASHATLPDSGYQYQWWHPCLQQPIPPTLPLINIAWSIFHFLHIFSNRHCSVLLIRHGSRIVHRSCVLPRFFRWPFMAADDLQITAVWTHPEFRHLGLARFALTTILQRFSDGKRTLWYLTQSDNPASLALSHAAGFSPFAAMERKNRFGIHALGNFRIVNHCPRPAQGRFSSETASVIPAANFLHQQGPTTS